MSGDDERLVGQGGVTLTRDGWQVVMDALEGDEASRDDAFDVLQRWAPPAWLVAHDARPRPERRSA